MTNEVRTRGVTPALTRPRDGTREAWVSGEDRRQPCEQKRPAAGGGAEGHLPQRCGGEGRPGGSDLLAVLPKHLLDELVHHF